jgi:hypothetical protein
MLAAWRMIEAGDTRCIGQVESPGFQALLRRVRDASRDGPAAGLAIRSLEQLAQLLALWRPCAAGQAGEAAYLAARFGGQRPAYFHPALAGVHDPTHGVLLYAVMWTFWPGTRGRRRAVRPTRCRSGLETSVRHCTEAARQRVDEAIKRVVQDLSQWINIHLVAAVGGVTTAYLYKEPAFAGAD